MPTLNQPTTPIRWGNLRVAPVSIDHPIRKRLFAARRTGSGPWRAGPSSHFRSVPPQRSEEVRSCRMGGRAVSRGRLSSAKSIIRASSVHCPVRPTHLFRKPITGRYHTRTTMLSTTRLSNSARAAVRTRRHVGTIAAVNHSRTKAMGDISSVFPSLNGAKAQPLPPRFAELKRSLVAGRENAIQDSWRRLLPVLDREIDEIRAKGLSVCHPPTQTTRTY